MDDFKHIEGEKIIIYNVREKNHKTIDTPCLVRHKEPRKTFEVKSNPIGDGRYGDVYETCEQADCTYVAKIIEKKNDYTNASLENESRNQMIAAGHGLAPTIHEIWICKDTVMLIMDRITGITLHAFLADPEKDDTIKARILKKVSTKIEKLHSIGIIHRDLHLKNIMVKDDESIIFIDFGRSHNYKKPIIYMDDFAILKDDLMKTFRSNKWLNEESSVLQGVNSNLGQKRTFLVGHRNQNNGAASASAAAAEALQPEKEFVRVEKPLPDWLKPNSKENVVTLTAIDVKIIEKIILKIQRIQEVDFLDNSDLIKLITNLGEISNAIRRIVYNRLKYKSRNAN